MCLSEIAQGLGLYDPKAARYRGVRRHYVELTKRIPPSRLVTSYDEVWMRAGLLAGMLARSQGHLANQRKELLADALIYLSASKVGLPILARNAAEFDLLNQLHPAGRVIVLNGTIRHREHFLDGFESIPGALSMLYEGRNNGKLIIRVD